MATFSGDVQYSQVMGHLPTPVQNPMGFLTQKIDQNRPVLDELLAGLNEAGDLGGIEDLIFSQTQWIARIPWGI